ncbi:MAG: AI-2E family transporter [Rikenellaceae bacterium]|nr:AI-2E family transporter [Rikenellaceae bacterium]MDY3893260.1 AI-2E family transporter [Candidatus Cryptobacteroides sp.]
MESQKHYTEILAKWLLAAFVAVIAWLLFRQFGSVVVYVLLAGVVSLIAKPLKMMLAKIRIKGHRAPDWFLAILSILLILVIFCGIIAGLAPMVKEVISDVASVTGDTSLGAISSNLAELNAYLVNTFDLDPGFRIEVAILHQVKSLINVNIFGNVIGSVASALASFGIGLFSVVFIAFFFIRDEKLFSRIICALAPDRHEDEVAQSLSDVEHLLSRYFIGLIVEMSCVGLIDFLGLWAIARLELGTAIGIGFMAGLLNIIPYVGPLLGGVLGTIIAMTIRYCGTGACGLDIGFWGFLAILVAIFMLAQLVDNFILQPVIYSTSIQASPLEIFIVMLLAGTMGGILGMLTAIPAYTVVRVVAGRFFPQVKFIRRLLGLEEPKM